MGTPDFWANGCLFLLPVWENWGWRVGAGSILGQKNMEMTLRSILNKKGLVLIFLLIAEFWRNGNL